MKRFSYLLLTLLLAIAGREAHAREVYSLNEGWMFYFADENTSDAARIVTLPHTWNLDAAGSPGPYRRAAAHYATEMMIPAEWRGKRIFVRFHGVQNLAEVFCNGRHAGEHRGGTTAFTFELTDKIAFGEVNSLAVQVSNFPQCDILPVSTDMNTYGGICRDVELIVTEQTAVSPLHLGSDGVLVRPKSVSAERVDAEAEIHLQTAPGVTTTLLTFEVTAPDGSRPFRRHQKIKLDHPVVTMPFSIPEPALWSPDSPALYRVAVIVGEGEQADTVRVTTGFRKIEVTPDGGFRLNGQRILLRGVTLRYDRPEVANAFTKRHYDADFAFVEEIGANALRSPAGPHAQYLYDRCDEAGIVAWIDLPFTRAPYLADIAYYPTARFCDNGREQLREMIAQYGNHPSVVMWGLFSSLRQNNRDDVQGYLTELNKLAHTADPSRPTVAASNQDGDINFISDLIVWQQNLGWERGSTDDLLLWSNLLRTRWSNLRSGVIYGEEGCLDHQGAADARSGRQRWLPEGRQTRFHEEYARHLDADSLFWGCWLNALFDYGAARSPRGVDCSGVVSFDRSLRKDAFYLYRALWNRRQPTLHIAGRREAVQRDSLCQFRIYASGGEAPVLLVGGDTVAVREYARCQYVSDSVSLQGVKAVEASAGALTDRIELRTESPLTLRTQPAPRRRGGLLQTN